MKTIFAIFIMLIIVSMIAVTLYSLELTDTYKTKCDALGYDDGTIRWNWDTLEFDKICITIVEVSYPGE